MNYWKMPKSNGLYHLILSARKYGITYAVKKEQEKHEQKANKETLEKGH